MGIRRVYGSQRYTVETDSTGAVKVTDTQTGKSTANRGSAARQLVKDVTGTKSSSATDSKLRKLFGR